MSLIVPKCNLMSHLYVCYDTLARKHRGPERNARAFADGKRTASRRRRPEKTYFRKCAAAGTVCHTLSLIVPNCNLMSHPEVCYDTIARYGRGPERNAGAFAYGNFPCRVQASFIRRGPERNAGAFPYGKKEKTGKGGEETEKPCEIPMPGSVTIWQHPAQETWAENRRKEECSA